MSREDYSKSAWLFDLHTIFKQRDGIGSEGAYRRVVDDIEEFEDLYEGGAMPAQAYEEFWN